MGFLGQVLIQFWPLNIHSEDMSPDGVSKLTPSISSVLSRRNVENLVQFFQCFVFSLWDEEEGKKEANEVETGVERESTLGLKGSQH